MENVLDHGTIALVPEKILGPRRLNRLNMAVVHTASFWQRKYLLTAVQARIHLVHSC